MATFVANPASGIDFTALTFADLIGDVLVAQTPNTWESQFGLFGSDRVVYHGIGLTYVGGSPTGGTLTEILKYESGALAYSISGFSVPAATFQAFRAADDSLGFLGAVFAGNDNITGSNQSDHLIGFAGADNIFGNGGIDLLFGGTGNDWLDGGSNTDALAGEDGNDTLDGGSGDDWLDGGKGNDVYYVNSKGDLITEALAGAAGGTDKVYSSASEFTLGNNLEQLVLTGSGDIDGTGNALANLLTGNAGNNELDGGGGNDSMAGGKGHDFYRVDSQFDVVTENLDAGSDTVWSTAPTYTLGANVEQLVLGGSADISGTGNSLGNYIQGNAGDNTLNGGGGKDAILALDGDDSVDGGLDDDTVNGNGGSDTISVSSGNDTVLYDDLFLGNDTVVGFDGNATGGQDTFNLDSFFDSLDVATADRDDLVTLTDNGATVDVEFNFFGPNVLATLNTADAVTIGEDVILGTL